MHLKYILFTGLIAAASARVLSRSPEDTDKDVTDISNKDEDKTVLQVKIFNNNADVKIDKNPNDISSDDDNLKDKDSDDKDSDDKDSDDKDSDDKESDDKDSDDKNVSQDESGASFGKCSPSMSFKKGREGRKPNEGTFLPDDKLIAQGQQDALDPNIITNRICDQIENKCGANDAGIKKCLEAKEKINALKEESNKKDPAEKAKENVKIAAAWNDALGERT